MFALFTFFLAELTAFQRAHFWTLSYRSALHEYVILSQAFRQFHSLGLGWSRFLYLLCLLLLEPALALLLLFLDQLIPTLSIHDHFVEITGLRKNAWPL